jgi:dihydropteroate synthase
MRPQYEWKIGRRSLLLGARTLVMGVLNVTPDSFSDGGRYFEPGRAVEHALAMLEDGADMVDVGGESTRPGAAVTPPARSEARVGHDRVPVSAEEELRRVLPVIEAIKRSRPESVIAVDTYKAAVAKAAAAAGAEIVNDISALTWDPEMAQTVAELGCGLVLMHMRGRPEQWRSMEPVPDMVALVAEELQRRAQHAMQAGIGHAHTVLDPGFGFGKNFEQNYPLLARLEELQRLGYPLMAGTSKKSFVGRALRRDDRDAAPEERVFGTVASEVIAIIKGAHVIRTHEVRACRDAARVADAILAASSR